MNTKTASYLAAAGLCLAALSACTSGPTIRTDYDRNTDFSMYRTYGYAGELGTDRAGVSTLVTSHFKRAVGRELESRGYRLAQSNPDLLVNFFVATQEKTDIRSTPSPTVGVGYYGYRYGLYTAWPAYSSDVSTVHYKTGTANVDVIDAKRKQLVWEGVAEGRVSDEALEDPGSSIDSVVAEIFAAYPARAGAPAVAAE